MGSEIIKARPSDKLSSEFLKKCWSIGSRTIAWDCCFRLCLRQVKNCPFAIRSVAQEIRSVLKQIRINKQLRTELTPEKL
jgi:hypothetical protein